MTDPKMPPIERVPTGRRRQRPTCLGLILVGVLFSFVGYILGIALLGLIDIWSEKFRPDLRDTIRSLRPYFGYGGAAISVAFGWILQIFFTPEPSNEANDQKPSKEAES